MAEHVHGELDSESDGEEGVDAVERHAHGRGRPVLVPDGVHELRLGGVDDEVLAARGA